MKVYLFARYVQKSYLEPVRTIVAAGASHGWKLSLSPNLATFFDKQKVDATYSVIESYEELAQYQPDYAITLGGDGTILAATCMIRDLNIPIMGINLGRLGFLASVERKKIEAAFLKLAEGDLRVEDRTMLCLESERGLFGDINFALNDFTIHKRDTSSMITIHTFVNGDYLNSYWADGLIVATPTGSTGYSLSCGGPIVFPNSGNMVITPVAPHNLNVRPLVLSDDTEISFAIEGRARNFLCTLDSRNEIITAKNKLTIKKSNFNTRLVRFQDQSFLNTIHEKLSWGADKRN